MTSGTHSTRNTRAATHTPMHTSTPTAPTEPTTSTYYSISDNEVMETPKSQLNISEARIGQSLRQFGKEERTLLSTSFCSSCASTRSRYIQIDEDFLPPGLQATHPLSRNSRARLSAGPRHPRPRDSNFCQVL